MDSYVCGCWRKNVCRCGTTSTIVIITRWRLAIVTAAASTGRQRQQQKSSESNVWKNAWSPEWLYSYVFLCMSWNVHGNTMQQRCINRSPAWTWLMCERFASHFFYFFFFIFCSFFQSVPFAHKTISYWAIQLHCSFFVPDVRTSKQ